MADIFYTPCFNDVYWFHLVRLSISPSVDRILSTLYLQQYLSDSFHICTSYHTTSDGVFTQLQMVCCVYSMFQNEKNVILANYLNL